MKNEEGQREEEEKEEEGKERDGERERERGGRGLARSRIAKELSRRESIHEREPSFNFQR